MNFEELSKEQKIMVSMRKVLTNIIKEITPPPGSKEYPLTENTVVDIRMCLALIAARERELAEARGITNKFRPHFVDEPQKTQKVSVYPMPRKNDK
jgi:acetolactate synthase small subunit